MGVGARRSPTPTEGVLSSSMPTLSHSTSPFTPEGGTYQATSAAAPSEKTTHGGGWVIDGDDGGWWGGW